MPGEIKREAVGREISKEEETGAGIEGGSASRSRGAGCRGQLFPFGFLASGVRNEHGDGAGFGIVSVQLLPNRSWIARNRRSFRSGIPENDRFHQSRRYQNV